jgi:hypothetical protein
MVKSSAMHMDKMSDYIHWTLANFDLAMFFLAIVFILFHRIINRRLPESEIVYRWMALFALGCTCIYAFAMHAYFPHFAAAEIGWTSTPFEFEVAMADLAIGIIAILSFSSSFGFRAATVIATMIFLWGDAVGHINQMIINSDFMTGNAGSWFWMDVFLPFILVICILKMKEGR